MPFDTWEDALAAQAMGDEEATALIAGRLAAIDKQLAGPSPAELEVQRLRGMQSFQKKVNLVAKEFPDVLDPTVDPEAYSLALKLDTSLQQRNPDMDETDRLRKVGEAVRRQLGDAEARDYSAAIRQQRVARKQSAESDDPDDGTDFDATENEIECGRSAQIAQMAQERKPREIPPEYLEQRRRSERR